jgi:hypothetical protein
VISRLKTSEETIRNPKKPQETERNLRNPTHPPTKERESEQQANDEKTKLIFGRHAAFDSGHGGRLCSDNGRRFCWRFLPEEKL